MKLLSAHIENFGKFSNRNFDFNDGLNVFCEENGWGKSTLSAFLKVMFYGFDNERARDEFENERKRYKPWQGGVYGGSIRFKVNEKVYRLNRTFGTKESEDEFLLLDATTGLASNDFTGNIGEEIFSIDAASFKKTVFLSQNDCATVTTDSINAKMGNLNDVADDLNCYEEVMKRFKNELNALSPTRATGEIKKLQDEIDGLEKKLQAKSVIENQLEEQMKKNESYREQIGSIKKESERYRKIQLYISEDSVRTVKEKTLNQLISKETERREECEKMKEFFGGNVPEANALKDAFAEAEELRSKEEAVRLTSLSEQELADEAEAKKMFEDSKFSETAHKEKMEQIDRFFATRNQYEKTLLSKEERDKLDDYSVKYSETNFRTTEIEELEKVWQEAETRRNSLMARKEAHAILENEERQVQKTSQVSPVIFIIPLVFALIASGCLIYFYVMNFAKIYLYCSGIPAAVLMIVTLLMLRHWYKRKKEKPIFLQSEEMKTQIVEEEHTIAAMENNIVMRLATKGLIQEGEELSKCFWRIKTEYDEFGELKRRRDNMKVDTNIEKMQKDATELEEYIAKYLKDKYSEKDLQAVIGRLFAQNEEDVALLDGRRAIWMDAMDQIEEAAKICALYSDKRVKHETSLKEKDELKKKLHELFEKMGVVPAEDMMEQIKNLQVELQSYMTASEEYEIAKKEREEYEKVMKADEQNDTKPEGYEEGITAEFCERKMEACKERLEDVTDNLTALRNMILYAQEQLDELSLEEANLSELKAKKADLQKRFRMVQMTKTHLENAKTAFTANYIGPVSAAFEKYAGKLDTVGTYEIALDADSNVTIQEAGMPRKTQAFSSGLQDLFGICLRMAFIEAMYKEEKPMIVFDDPFANLDEKKISGGLEFLRELSKEYQVIYFTCHKDRVGEKA
ncbi:MAG: hypothetical protein E7288_06585 [Lachnospiraceae bacterium]|nr:hypothetical protein [Lachnospiraceae bacterium]